MYLPMYWKRAPKIEIDHNKCTVPMYCKLCLQACPQACFRVDNVRFERLKESNREEPGAYVLSAAFRYNCTLCHVCIDVCPVGAITITPREE
jgi:ferredoxin